MASPEYELIEDRKIALAARKRRLLLESRGCEEFQAVNTNFNIFVWTYVLHALHQIVYSVIQMI